MKRLRILLIAMLIADIISAQTSDEWLQQKKTQIKYLVQQMTALQAYAMIAEKGYSIAKTGLNAIGNIKKGDFTLHSYYFTSLKKVNSNVKACPKIAEIIAIQLSTVKACHQQKVNMSKSGQFNSNEISFAGKVFDNLLEGCAEIIEELIAVTTDGLLQMKEDERIKNIDKLYTAMQERQQFVQRFGNDNNKLALQRIRDANDVNVVKGLYMK
jgi:phosphopantetheine adenylyltransferase